MVRHRKNSSPEKHITSIDALQCPISVVFALRAFLSRLLANSSIFVDSNSRQHGKNLDGAASSTPAFDRPKSSGIISTWKNIWFDFDSDQMRNNGIQHNCKKSPIRTYQHNYLLPAGSPEQIYIIISPI